MPIVSYNSGVSIVPGPRALVINPFRTVIPFGGTNYLALEWFVHKSRLQFLPSNGQERRPVGWVGGGCTHYHAWP